MAVSSTFNQGLWVTFMKIYRHKTCVCFHKDIPEVSSVFKQKNPRHLREHEFYFEKKKLTGDLVIRCVIPACSFNHPLYSPACLHSYMCDEPDGGPVWTCLVPLKTKVDVFVWWQTI